MIALNSDNYLFSIFIFHNLCLRALRSWTLFCLGIPEGGLVPKSFYMTPQEFEKDQSPGPHLMDNSCYCSISLNKGQVREDLV